MSDLTYAYAQPSALAHRPEGNVLQLAAYAEDAPTSSTACFFQGQLRDSWLAARGLSTLAKVVTSRFVPLGAVLRDPIVTAGAGRLRFEAFSSCNGVYARLDLGPAALDGEFAASGTTNVDFNEPMLNALARIGRAEPVGLTVGQQEVTLARAAGTVTERKVALPLRWLKGLTAAQGYLAQMDEKLRLGRAQAAQLLHSLPAGAAKSEVFLTLRGARPSFGPVGGPGAVRVGGAHRLRLLDGLLPLAQAARVYATPDGQASAVVLELGGGQEFLLALSAAANRGFSGEGTQLSELLDELPAEWLAGANNLFRANETFNPTLFGLAHDLAPGTVARLCASLSAMGLLGFDLTDNQYFYRRLPFRTDRILQLNPRLQNARALLAAPDEVQLVGIGPGGRTEVRVHGTDVWHTVLVGGPELPRCTCQWFTAHQGQRGLCKHVLAAQLWFG
ncbi:MAG: SWIM zinc finger family protein [Janthinobacterium lividum]